MPFREKIYISPNRALAFGVLTKKSKFKKDDGVLVEIKSISENKHSVLIEASVNNKIKNLRYKKAGLTNDNCYFIAWSYLILEDWENRVFNNQKASEYIEKTFEKESFLGKIKNKDLFPRFLILKYELSVSGSGNAYNFLYNNLDNKDMPHPLFKEVYQKERHPIKKVHIAEKALKRFPNDYFFVNAIAEYHLRNKKYKKCEEFIKQNTKIKELVKETDEILKLTYFYCLLGQKKYSMAKEVVSTPLNGWDGDYSNFLKGEVLFEEGKYAEAIPYFIKEIKNDPTNTATGITSSYYLLACYAKTKNDIELVHLVENMPLEHDEVFLLDIKHSYKQKAEKILESILKQQLDEVTKAKLEGLYAYFIQEDPTYEGGVPRKLTKQEKVRLLKGIKLIKKALDYFPNSIFFNTVYSNLLYRNGKHEESVIQKIKTYSSNNKSGLYAQAELSECSEKFLYSYPEKIRMFSKNDNTILEKYIEYLGFEQDVGTLWNKKMYKTIVDLYLFLKPFIEDVSTVGDSLSGYGGGGAFEIAYSLRELGYSSEAKNIYEKILKKEPSNSAVLNNLSLIFEEEGNKKQASLLIKKAKKFTKDTDEIIERNTKRILSKKISTETDGPHESQKENSPHSKIKLEIKNGCGILFIKNNKVELGSEENVPFLLLQALLPFGSTKGTNSVFSKSSSNRSKYTGEELSLLEKQTILKNRIKELQEILRKGKIKVNLVFDESNETVLLKYK